MSNTEDISINKIMIESILKRYNEDKTNLELELVYKTRLKDFYLPKILNYLENNFKNAKIENEYILDVSIKNTPDYRLSIKSTNSEIVKNHCIFEKSCQENPKNITLPDNYSLEFKSDALKYDIIDLNTKLNLKNEYIVDDLDIIDNFLNTLMKFKKTYRLKKRRSIILKDYRIDITFVKMSEGKNIILSNLNNIISQIDFEIEYIGLENITTDILFEMIKIMGIINQYNNPGYFNISNKTKYEIEKKYKTLLKPILNTYKISGIGPKVVSLNRNNITNMFLGLDMVNPEKSENLIEDYAKSLKLKKEEVLNKLHYKITQKADGERYTMFIDELKFIYLLNDRSDILKTGLQLDGEGSDEYINSVLDGELLFYKKDNEYVYEYLYFDIYVKNGKEVYDLLLADRIKEMDILNKLLESTIKYIQDDLYINCKSKSYYGLSEFKKVYERKYDYHIDGIILMYDLPLLNISNKTDNKILKYKPIEENTIDVLVKNKNLYCGYDSRNYNGRSKYVDIEIICSKPYILDIHKKPIKIKKNGKLELIDYKMIENKIVEILYSPENECFIYNRIRTR